jgi:hypothetical protein
MSFADEIKQMMIGYMLDLIGKNYEPAINFIQFPAVELIT